jgi:3-hydroxyacyl-[acyl-carrier-protein] dehydratase
VRFLFVDDILELTPGQCIKASKTVSHQEDYFEDHFPGFPVVPGVLLTEMMAQAAGKCLFAENPARGRPMLVKITEANFRQWMRPGETAVILARVKKSRGTFALAECQVEVAGRQLCTADLFFTFVPNEKFAVDYRDELLERFLEKGAGPGLTPSSPPVEPDG